jgi:hypothetical protein
MPAAGHVGTSPGTARPVCHSRIGGKGSYGHLQASVAAPASSYTKGVRSRHSKPAECRLYGNRVDYSDRSRTSPAVNVTHRFTPLVKLVADRRSPTSAFSQHCFGPLANAKATHWSLSTHATGIVGSRRHIDRGINDADTKCWRC